MSVRTQKNVTSVQVGKNIAGTAIASISTLDDMADGQIVAVKSTGAVLGVGDTVDDSNWIRLVKKLVRNGVSTFQYSPIIRGVDVVDYRGVAYSAGQEQIYIVGYNGSSGSIDTTANNYMFSIVFDHDTQFWSEQKKRESYEYHSSSPTQATVARSVAEQVNFKSSKNILNGTGAEVKAELLNSGTAADPSTATTIAVVNGSDIITLSGADTSVQTVGVVLRLGSTGSGVGTTVPVYVVTATPSTDSTLSAAQARINTAFQGTSATLDATSGDAGVVTAGSNWGVKFTGLALTWVKDFFKYMRVSFHFDMVGFGNTTLTKTQEAKKGRGDYRDIAEWESFTAGSEGALNRAVVPLPLGRTEVPTDGSIAGYDMYCITIRDRSIANTVAGDNSMLFDILVCVPDGAAQDTKLASQLDPWMGSLPLAFATAGGL